MRRSSSGSIWTIALCAAFSLLALGMGSATGQANEGRFVPFVQRLMRAAFPELNDTILSVSLVGKLSADWETQEFSLVQANLTRTEFPDERSSRTLRSAPLLNAVFEREDGAFRAAYFSGPHVVGLGDELVKDIRDHPEWEMPQVEAALGRFGAKFRVDDAQGFLAAMDMSRFAAVLGPVVKSSASFQWRPAPANADPNRPFWLTHLEVRDGADGRACYTLTNEPLDGRITAIMRRKCG